MKALILFFALSRPKPAHSCHFWPRTSHRTVVRIIRCAENHWPVPGGFEMALCIAQRESGLYPKAQNPTSSALGIYQVVQGTWDSWWRSAPDFRRWWHVGYDRSNPRNNVLMSVRKMSHEGLGPWGGAC
mgnify:FL=1